MDVEDIAPGQRFAQAIDDTIAGCDVVLIVIGPGWAEILRHRQQSEQVDYLRREIESALHNQVKRRQIKIVPVLVGGASMAELSGLPEGLAALSQFEAAELRDSTFTEDCSRLAKSLGIGPRARVVSRKAVMTVLAIAVVVAVVAAAIAWSKYRARKAALDPMFATAKSQADRGEYESAFNTYARLLKADPANRDAAERQLDAAMRWIEDFHAVGDKASSEAAARLDIIMPVLDSGFARSNGKLPRTVDILAHIGWAHWLNRHIAQREFGPAAERALRGALLVEPSNVFANAMLGNYMMQTGGDVPEAIQHFRTAVEQKKERPLVRSFQLGVLTYPRDGEIRKELIRVANDMRRGNEPLEPSERRRILSCYNPTVTNAEELVQTLSAVPPADAWATYQWLDDSNTSSESYRRVQREFVRSSILELDGKLAEARAAFENLRTELKRGGINGRIATYVDAAIARLNAH